MYLNTKLLMLAVAALIGGDAMAAGKGEGPIVGRALGLVRNHTGIARASAADGFLARDAIIDADGTEHVRFDRTYNGLPVIGGDLVVHSRNGQFKSASITQQAALNLSTRPAIEADEAGVESQAMHVSRPPSARRAASSHHADRTTTPPAGSLRSPAAA